MRVNGQRHDSEHKPAAGLAQNHDPAAADAVRKLARIDLKDRAKHRRDQEVNADQGHRYAELFVEIEAHEGQHHREAHRRYDEPQVEHPKPAVVGAKKLVRAAPRARYLLTSLP